MSFLSLVRMEFRKIRRSRIIWILLAAVLILWIPSIMNSDLNFGMQQEGISPENNFFIQGFMAMAWFMYPASMIVSTVLLIQTERNNHGILKMLSLPVATARLCMAKFVVLISIAAMQMGLSVGMYYVSAGIASHIENYNLLLSPVFVCKEVFLMWLVSIPMIAFFWLLSVCITTPIFSIGIGLASIVPSVLIINTKVWFAYPMSYPFFFVSAEYGKLASNLETAQIEFLPWIPVAVGITLICMMISCLEFGRAERR